MPVKSIARRVLAHRAIGAPAAALLGGLGQGERRSRVLELCGYMPSTIAVRIPPHLHPHASFAMTSPAQVDQIAWRLWVNGWNGFERPLLDLYALCARRAGTVLDIGANSGLYSLVAAAVADEGLTVHAFEPLPSALQALRRNVELNEAAGRVRVVEAAVADAPGTAQFFVPAGNEGLLEMSASLSASFRHRHAEVLEVTVVTVDQYVAAQRIPTVDVMKVDVESQEHRVFAGAAHTLRTHRPLVFFEALAGSDVQSIDAQGKAAGYRAVQVHAAEICIADRVVIDPQGVNQILCPEERIQPLCAMAAALGLRIREEPIETTLGAPAAVPQCDAHACQDAGARSPVQPGSLQP